MVVYCLVELNASFSIFVFVVESESEQKRRSFPAFLSEMKLLGITSSALFFAIESSASSIAWVRLKTDITSCTSI